MTWGWDTISNAASLRDGSKPVQMQMTNQPTNNMTHKQQQALSDQMITLGGYVNSYGITCLRAYWAADGLEARMLQFEPATSAFPKFFAMSGIKQVSLKDFAVLVECTEEMIHEGLITTK